MWLRGRLLGIQGEGNGRMESRDKGMGEGNPGRRESMEKGIQGERNPGRRESREKGIQGEDDDCSLLH